MKFKASISTNNAAVLRNYVVAIKINTVTRTYNLKYFSDRLTFVWILLSRPDLLQSDLVWNHGRLSMKTCAQKLKGKLIYMAFISHLGLYVSVSDGDAKAL